MSRYSGCELINAGNEIHYLKDGQLLAKSFLFPGIKSPYEQNLERLRLLEKENRELIKENGELSEENAELSEMNATLRQEIKQVRQLLRSKQGEELH